MSKNSKLKLKSGFTLAEALVSMLVLSLFFMATAKIITIKQPAEKLVTVHGFFECYIDTEDSKLKQHYYENGSSGIQLAEDNKCVFIPSRRIPSVVQYKIIPGGTEFYQSVETLFINSPDADNPDDRTFTIRREWLTAGNTTYENNYMDNPDRFDNTKVLYNLLEKSYPSSKVVESLKDPATFGGAIFISW